MQMQNNGVDPELAQFNRELMEEVNGIQGVPDNQALFNYCADNGLLDQAGDFTESECDLTLDFAGNPRVRINAYDDNAFKRGELNLLVTEYNGDNEILPISQSVCEGIVQNARDFVYNCANTPYFGDKLVESAAGPLAQRIYDSWQNEKIKTVNILVLTNRIKNEDTPEVGDFTPVDEVPVSYSLYDLKVIGETHWNGSADLVIDLDNDFEAPWNVLQAVQLEPVTPKDSKDELYRSYIGVITGELLYRLYKRWDKRLLEDNVRVFLGLGGKINSQLISTIENDPENFFAYNNGLTATAQYIEYDSDRGCIALMKNLHIVNGAQTTGAIFTAKNQNPNLDLSKLFVQIKITEVQEPRISIELLPKITRFSNSQNKLNTSDFDANHPYHEAMERLSLTIPTPTPKASSAVKEPPRQYWFYERSRGSYSLHQKHSTSLSEFKKMFPTTNKITKDELAKSMETWNGNPDQVSRGSSNNFVIFGQQIKNLWDHGNADHFKNLIPDKINGLSPDHTEINEQHFTEMISKHIVTKELQKKISAKAGGWYNQQRGIRAGLVTYSIAFLQHSLQQYHLVIDFNHIWKLQTTPEPIMNVLMEIAQRMATLDDPLYLESMEKAKSFKHWQYLTEGKTPEEEGGISFKLWGTATDIPRDLGGYLISEDDYSNYLKNAQQQQRKTYRSRLGAAIRSVRARFWSDVMNWCIEKDNELSQNQTQVLSKTASAGAEIEAQDCVELLEIYKNCISSGMYQTTPALDELFLQYGKITEEVETALDMSHRVR